MLIKGILKHRDIGHWSGDIHFVFQVYAAVLNDDFWVVLWIFTVATTGKVAYDPWNNGCMLLARPFRTDNSSITDIRVD